MDHRNWPIAKDALWFAVPLAVLTGIARFSLGGYVWVLPGALLLFTLFFFRNPQRRCDAGEKDLLSPADGKVMQITDVPEESEYLLGPALKISIFLNLLNVHINRSPARGFVEHVRHKEGKFIPAYKSHASEINERNYLGILTGGGQKILLVQIVGLLARRVVCWSKAGDELGQGERFGLMRFGSCVEMYVPPDTVVYIKPGDQVRGGLTKLGRLP